MEQSPYLKSNRSTASQEFPRIFLNPKLNDNFHKSLSPVPILSQNNSVHNPSRII
jgi:hypothetical protein